jgi:hypothetical protein
LAANTPTMKGSIFPFPTVAFCALVRIYSHSLALVLRVKAYIKVTCSFMQTNSISLTICKVSTISRLLYCID